MLLELGTAKALHLIGSPAALVDKVRKAVDLLSAAKVRAEPARPNEPARPGPVRPSAPAVAVPELTPAYLASLPREQQTVVLGTHCLKKGD